MPPRLRKIERSAILATINFVSILSLRYVAKKELRNCDGDNRRDLEMVVHSYTLDAANALDAMLVVCILRLGLNALRCIFAIAITEVILNFFIAKHFVVVSNNDQDWWIWYIFVFFRYICCSFHVEMSLRPLYLIAAHEIHNDMGYNYVD